MALALSVPQFSEKVILDSETPSLESREIYQAFPSLERYKEFLGHIEWKNICGKWACAVIIRNGHSFVGKYGLSNEEQALLEQEFWFHDTALEILNYGKRMGYIPDTVAIPRLRFRYGHNSEQPYIMEFIKGMSLFSMRMIEKYFPQKPIESFRDKSDHDIRRMIFTDFGVDICSSADKTRRHKGIATLERFYPSLVPDLREVLIFLKSHGIQHKDLHDGNIMMAADGKLHIIDFGTIQYSPPRLLNFRNATRGTRIFSKAS